MRSRLAIVLVAGLLAPHAIAEGTASAAAVRLEVMEAAVRWGLTNPEVAAAGTVYLEVDQGVPADELLARLTNVPNLVSVAKCPREESYGRLACRPPKGALVLAVWDVRMLGGSSAKVRIGHYEGPMSGMACGEYLTREKAGWRRRAAAASESRECGVS